MINSYDLDGVIFMGSKIQGFKPRASDIIITGRSFQEREYTEEWLKKHGISNRVYFNPTKYVDKSREDSGWHKANTINQLIDSGVVIGAHIDDDPVQAMIVDENTSVEVILVGHNLVKKENMWHGAPELKPTS